MTSSLQAVATKERIFTLDVLRGFALLGILVMNLPAAGLTSLYYEGAIHFFNLNPGDYYSWFILDIFVSGKMRFLFSMLFGAGILLFLDKKPARQSEDQFTAGGAEGASTTAAFYRRMLWMFVFGLIDLFLIIWTGDVLYCYALCGMALFFCRKFKPWLLLTLGIISISAIAWNSNTNFAASKERRGKYLQAEQMLKEGKKLTADLDSARVKWIAREKQIYPFSPEMIAKISEYLFEELSTKKHDFPETFINQAQSAPMAVLDAGFYWDLLEAASAMLIGMALFKWNFFSGSYSLKRYWLIAVTCLLVALPFAYAITHGPNSHAAHHYVQYLDGHRFSLTVFEQIPRVLMAISFAAFIIMLCKAGWLRFVTNAFAATGRMAFTNYLVQNIFFTVMFYGYTFDKYSAFTRNELLLMVPLIWLIQTLFSIWWLKRFEMGPLEWVWRRLTYGKSVVDRRGIQ